MRCQQALTVTRAAKEHETMMVMMRVRRMRLKLMGFLRAMGVFLQVLYKPKPYRMKAVTEKIYKTLRNWLCTRWNVAAEFQNERVKTKSSME